MSYNYEKLTPFKKYIIQNFPYIDADFDALTNYELYAKVVEYLNKVIEQMNLANETVAEYTDFVTNYFNNLDVQEEINNKLDDMAEDGSLTQLIGAYVQPILDTFENQVNTSLGNMQTQINSVASGSPKGVYSTLTDLQTENPDHSYIYLVLADGKWYYYLSGSGWTAGGTYQGTSASDNSITIEKLNSDVKFNLNQRTIEKFVYDLKGSNKIDLSNNLINANINSSTGAIENRTDNIYFATPYYYYIPKNCIINFIKNVSWTVNLYFYDSNFNYIEIRSDTASSNECMIINNITNASYVRFRISKDSLATTTTDEIISTINYLEFISIYNHFNTTVGTNKFNPSKYFVGYLGANESGIYKVLQLDNTTYRTTYPIPVKANQPYTISRLRQFILLDSNMKYISGTVVNADTSNYTFTPASDGFAVFSYNSTYANTLIMNEGSTVATYKPYKEYLPDYIDLSNIIQSETKDFLYNKKYIALGDSFTHGDFTSSPTNDYTITSGVYSGEYKVYPFLIGNRLNMDVTNLAQNGMTITNINGTSENYLSDSILEQIPEDVDYITIKIGINDNPDHQNAPLGTIQSTDRTTFYGAWNYVMDYLITNYPNAKIGIIVSNGMTNLDYINAEINIAKRYGIKYINETTDSNVPLLIRTERTDVLQSVKTLRNNEWEVLPGTNAHPNAKCHEYESTIIENFLRSL